MRGKFGAPWVRNRIIHNIWYYRVGPSYPYYISHIIGWAHPIEYMIYRVGPSYLIYDITGWAHHIEYNILLAVPVLYLPYHQVGPPYIICHIAGCTHHIHIMIYDSIAWVHHTQLIYALLLSWPSGCIYYAILHCSLGLQHISCDIIGGVHHFYILCKQYYYLGPPHLIYDNTTSTHHYIVSAILLVLPTLSYYLLSLFSWSNLTGCGYDT